jgi:hypothetical protein
MSQAPPGAPRRDILGFFKAVVEFFTGTTRVVVAGLGLLGTVITLVLVQPTPAPGPVLSSPTPAGAQGDPGPQGAPGSQRLTNPDPGTETGTTVDECKEAAAQRLRDGEYVGSEDPCPR